MSVEHTDGLMQFIRPKNDALKKIYKLMRQFWDNVDKITIPSTVSEAGEFQRALVRIFRELFWNKRSMDELQETLYNETWGKWHLNEEWCEFLKQMEYECRTHKDIEGNRVQNAQAFKACVSKVYLVLNFWYALEWVVYFTLTPIFLCFSSHRC